jgi:hypothetical protein
VTTLSDDELARLRVELADHVLASGAEPYFKTRAVYDIVQDYLQSSATAATSCATAVVAPGAATLTLGSVAGLVVGTPLVLDVDDARERVTVRYITGSTVSVLCKKTHAGTYPVEVESPLTIVRGILADLAAIDDALSGARATGHIKQVDEVHFFGRSEGGTQLQTLVGARAQRRLDLARACALPMVLAANSGAGGADVEVY